MDKAVMALCVVTAGLTVGTVFTCGKGICSDAAPQLATGPSTDAPGLEEKKGMKKESFKNYSSREAQPKKRKPGFKSRGDAGGV